MATTVYGHLLNPAGLPPGGATVTITLVTGGGLPTIGFNTADQTEIVGRTTITPTSSGAWQASLAPNSVVRRPDGNFGTVYRVTEASATGPVSYDYYITVPDVASVWAGDIRTQLASDDSSYILTVLTNPDRIQVSDDIGELAMLTVGSKTVTMRGPTRTFTEQKRVGSAYKDSFTRTRTSGWGTSPYYGSWTGRVGGVDADYTCNGSTARIAVTSTNVSRYTSLNDADVTGPFDVRTSVTTSTTPAGANNSAAVTFCYASTSNHYRAQLTFTSAGLVQASISRLVGGTSTTISSTIQVGTGYVANQKWWIRVTHNGTGTIGMYAWKDGTTPPTSPNVTASDTTYIKGRVGVRVLASTGSTNTPTFIFDDFEITSGQWSNPPVISHSTWVRVLDAPFTSFSAGVQSQIGAWKNSATPDVLDRAMSYITGAPAVLDPALGTGKQVLGQSSYGPTNTTTGLRDEGSDFNDYIRISWSYPDLAVPTTDINEAVSQYCLDCSGFIRMVWGYWFSIPMCLSDPADFNGLRLPRKSVDQSTQGPGVLIANGGSAPPSTVALQIGDLVFFDADAADNVAGEDSDDVELNDDHVGIYIGPDQAGHQIFISSRKTANGVSFGTVGGPAWLDGTGYWAQSFRHIRRV